jgi:hypothetical protein
MRYTNPEAGLNLAVVNFVLQCAAMKSLDALSMIDLQPEVLRDLIEMSGEDIARLSMVKDPLFKIEINRDTWDRVKPGVLQLAAERQLRNDLIIAGAPRAMIERWWPMRHKEFALLRRMLGAQSVGRTRAATEQEEHAVWHAWSDIGADNDLGKVRPADYLELYQRTSVSLQLSWALTNRWASEGRLQNGVRQIGSQAKSR